MRGIDGSFIFICHLFVALTQLSFLFLFYFRGCCSELVATLGSGGSGSGTCRSSVMSKNGCIVHMVVWIEMQNIIGSKCKILFVKTFAGGILKRNTRVSTVQHLISVFTEQCNGLAAQVAVIYQSSVPVSMPVRLLLTVSRHAAQGLCYHLKCSILSRFHKESQKYECFKRHGYKSPIN